jgi:uncharacterized metal-binding protein YceD (DUF177 family)
VIAEETFSRPIKVDALPRDGLDQTIEATPAERAAVAKQNGLVDVSKLSATFDLQRQGRHVRVVGSVHAEVTQTCVVSLEPFAVTLDEPVDVRFAPPRAEKLRGKGEAETVVLEGEDGPDPIVDGKIDLGALAAEFMALGLDRYPRKPGAEFTPPATDEPLDSPFDALAKIAKKGG